MSSPTKSSYCKTSFLNIILEAARKTSSLRFSAIFQLFCKPGHDIKRKWKREREKYGLQRTQKTSIQPALCGGHLWGYRGVRVLLPKHWLSLQKHRKKITDRRSWKSSGELAPDLTGSCAVVLFSSVERALLHMQCSGLHALSHCVRQSRTGCRGHAHRLPGSSGKKKKERLAKSKTKLKKKKKTTTNQGLSLQAEPIKWCSHGKNLKVQESFQKI